MKCETVREHFSDLVDNNIDQVLNVAIDNHFISCDACRQEYDGFKRTWETLESIPWVEPPAHLRNKVMTALRNIHSTQPEPVQPAWRAWLDNLVPATPARRGLGWSAAVLASVVVFGMIAHVNNGISLWVSPPVTVTQAPSTLDHLNSVQVTPIEQSTTGSDIISLKLSGTPVAVQVDTYVLSPRSKAEGWDPKQLSSTDPTQGLQKVASQTIHRGGLKIEPLPFDKSDARDVNLVLMHLHSGVSNRYIAVFVPTNKHLTAVASDTPVIGLFSQVIYDIARNYQVGIIAEAGVDARVSVVASGHSALNATQQIAAQSGVSFDVQPNGFYVLTR